MKTAYYFSHDSNARRDPKILAMRHIFGTEGYGWFWIIIEMMSEQEDYKLSLVDKYSYNVLAEEMNTTKENAKEFVTKCIAEIGLFQQL